MYISVKFLKEFNVVNVVIVFDLVFLQLLQENKVDELKWRDWSMQTGYTKDEPEAHDHDAEEIDYSDEQMPRRALSPGKNMGLTVLLDVKKEEYLCSSSQSIGFKVF